MKLNLVLHNVTQLVVTHIYLLIITKDWFSLIMKIKVNAKQDQIMLEIIKNIMIADNNAKMVSI